jgi:hypothetical protein
MDQNAEFGIIGFCGTVMSKEHGHRSIARPVDRFPPIFTRTPLVYLLISKYVNKWGTIFYLAFVYMELQHIKQKYRYKQAE